MYTFNIQKAFYDKNIKLFPKAKLNIKTGTTILVGCNGSGKSTLIKQMISQLKNDGIEYIYYNNLTDGGSASVSQAIWNNNITLAAASFCASEGEQIGINIGQVASRCGAYVRAMKNNNSPLFFFFDAIDSGFSIDNIIDFKENLLDVILKDNNNAHIVIAANSYEMAKGQNCLDLHTFTYINFESYDEYSKYIIKSRKHKDTLYNKRKDND